MHDLLRDLGRSLTQGENLCAKDFIEMTNPNESVMKLRNLRIKVSASHSSSNASSHVDFIRKCSSLRYLGLESLEVDVEGVNQICKANKRLRILHLTDAPIVHLPSSILNLIHLRYLHLEYLTISELPDSIGDLSNLLFLYLISCKFLRNLPRSVVRLQNLRAIDLSDTDLEGMPAGWESLKNLQKVMRFSIHEGDVLSRQNQTEWCSLEDLSCLPFLRQLYIYHLDRAKVSDDNHNTEMESIFRNNSCLEKLYLDCTLPIKTDTDEEIIDSSSDKSILDCTLPSEIDTDEEIIDSSSDKSILNCTLPSESELDVENIEKVFEFFLCPPDSLEILWIRDFYGRSFPSWISCSYLPNVSTLQLFNCHYCTNLPPLGMLPNLSYLKISCARDIKIIGPEFLGLSNHGGSSSSFPPNVIFPKLENLYFEYLKNWSEWIWDIKEREETSHGGICKAFPCLKEIAINGCPLLKSLPHSFYLYGAESLQDMHIEDSGLEELGHLPSLRKLLVENKDNKLQRVSNLPKLEVLYLYPNSMDSLPQWLLGRRHGFSSLRLLHTEEGCKMLRGICDREYCPVWPLCSHHPQGYQPR